MANGGDCQGHLFGQAVLSELDSYLCFGDDVAMCDDPDEAIDVMLDTGGFHDDNCANLMQMLPSDISAAIAAPAFPSTRDVDNMPEVGIQPHLRPPRIAYPETRDINVQEAPAAQVPPDVPDGTIEDSNMTGLIFSVQTRYATTEDWERYRALFTRLYRDENKTLKDVKSIMKEKYGFNATDKMYKKRIDDWQLRKNCKALEKEEILKCIETNRELGFDLGEPIINGRTVKMHIIERHQKEKRKVSMAGARSTKRACLQRAGFSASISFSRIEDPAEYRNFENLLFQIDQYYNAKLENDPHAAWDAWEQSSFPQSVKVTYTFQDSIYTCAVISTASMFNRYVAAFRLLKANHHRDAWRMIQEGAEMVRPILLLQCPEFIRELLASLSFIQSAAHDELKTELLRLISNMAIVVHGDRHPISILCQLLQTLHGNRDVISLGMSKIRDVFKRRLGHTHFASIHTQRRHCLVLLQQKMYDEAERTLLDIINICEDVYGRNHRHTRESLHYLADQYFLKLRDSEAEDVLVDVLQRGKEWGDCDFVNILANTMQGDIYSHRGDYEAAETSYWSALSGSLHSLGPKDSQTVRTRIRYKKVAALLQKHRDTFTEILEEPVRCLSRSRSSSQPPVAHRKRKAGFWYEAPV